jgi:hypothetical protein
MDPLAPHLSPSGAAAPIYVIDRTDVVRVFIDIPEHDANFVKVGTKASVLAKAYRDQPIPAAVTRTAWALNAKSRTLRAEIDLENSDVPSTYKDHGSHPIVTAGRSPAKGGLLPGMYADVKVIIERPGVRAMPASALTYRGDQAFFWAYEHGHAVQTEVQTGVSDGEWIEVTNRRVRASQAAFQSEDLWVPIDGQEQMILGDLSLLTEGAAVEVAPATAETTLASRAPEPARRRGDPDSGREPASTPAPR